MREMQRISIGAFYVVHLPAYMMCAVVVRTGVSEQYIAVLSILHGKRGKRQCHRVHVLEEFGGLHRKSKTLRLLVLKQLCIRGVRQTFLLSCTHKHTNIHAGTQVLIRMIRTGIGGSGMCAQSTY